MVLVLTNNKGMLEKRFSAFGFYRKNPVFRAIAFEETYRFLTIQSLEFQAICQKEKKKNSSETTWMIYHVKTWILT